MAAGSSVGGGSAVAARAAAGLDLNGGLLLTTQPYLFSWFMQRAFVAMARPTALGLACALVTLVAVSQRAGMAPVPPQRRRSCVH